MPVDKNTPAKKPSPSKPPKKAPDTNGPGQTPQGQSGGVWARFERFFGGQRDGTGRLRTRPTVTMLRVQTEQGWNGLLKQWVEWSAAQRTTTTAVVMAMAVELLAELVGVARATGEGMVAGMRRIVVEQEKQTALLKEQTELLRAQVQRQKKQEIQTIDAADGDSDGDSDGESEGDDNGADGEDDGDSDGEEEEEDDDEEDEDGDGEDEDGEEDEEDEDGDGEDEDDGEEEDGEGDNADEDDNADEPDDDE